MDTALNGVITIKPFRSIKRKLTTNLVIAFTAIILIVLTIVAVVGVYTYERFMYEQLKEVARIKSQTSHSRDRSEHSEEENALVQSGIWVAHFRVEKSGEDIKLQIDAFTERLFAMRDEEAIYKMAELVKSNSDELGNIHEDDITYYYYFDYDANPGGTMVYYLADKRGGSALLILVLAAIMIIAIIPIAYRFSGAIVNPILELELFAEEVAMRNWEAKTPKTENDEIGMLANALDRMKEALKLAEE